MLKPNGYNLRPTAHVVKIDVKGTGCIFKLLGAKKVKRMRIKRIDNKYKSRGDDSERERTNPLAL